jgi:GNAT superfamily N-acetyltransferase
LAAQACIESKEIERIVDFHHPPHYLISTDRERLDLDRIHRFLSEESYWATGISRTVVERAIQNSLPFGMYDVQRGAQIGFARVLSDYATFAYIDDVFLLADYRGTGLGKWLMECILAHPDLQHLRRWLLLTRHSQEFYKSCGFEVFPFADRVMQISHPEVYQS